MSRTTRTGNAAADTIPAGYPNLRAVGGKVVHKAAMRKLWGDALIVAPACKTRQQLMRQIITGLSVSDPVTCTRPACRS